VPEEFTENSGAGWASQMRNEKPEGALRRGWTTGACATAATKAALSALLTGDFPDPVSITLPRGEMPAFPLAKTELGKDFARVGIIKDAGDDPDVTHGAMVVATVRRRGRGVTFRAGDGVGTITKPGLPVPVGEPAINPVPREMMRKVVAELGGGDVEIEISVPGGQALAEKTWNPRLGIVGGLSILGTTGVVHPYSCAAWIASIHRGIDVARAAGFSHVAACTGSTSEAAVRAHFGLPLEAMLDMGDFAGGVLKYLRVNPVPRLTIGGGFAKMVKLAQGSMDLHSGRSQVDFEWLAERVGVEHKASVKAANTALEVLELCGAPLAQRIANEAAAAARDALRGSQVLADVLVISRDGKTLASSGIT
jgi:cobalt-precorrin-5B (C1)-methyltransferase